MPVLHSIIHKIDKKPDGSPAILHRSGAELVESQARDDLMQQLNESYNAKTGKAWGFFHAESGAYPFSGWLGKYLAGTEDFMEFSSIAVEHLTRLMEESNLSIGGNALFCHYLQGMTDYLVIALVQETEAVVMTDTLVSYAMAQAKLGESITLDELSEVLDDDQPLAFAEFVQGKDYGLSASIPPDKKTLTKFRRFTGRSDGLSISFDSHLLGSKVEFDEAGGTLMLRGLPTQLTDQLKRAAT